MDSLIKQTRPRYSGVRKSEDTSGGGRETRIPTKKSVSFKEEKKKPQNWFKKQLSRQMSGRKDYDPLSDTDHVTAVAAAAFAITCYLDETEQRKPIGDKPETGLTKPKSRREAVISLQEPRTPSKRFSGQGSMKISETDGKKPEKSPSIKKAPTFAINFGGTDEKTKPEKPVPKPGFPSPKPAVQPQKTKSETPPPPGTEDDDTADSWERAELTKIKERNEKLRNKIASYEERRKAKAKRKLERTEAELDQKRKRAMRKFRESIGFIDRIVAGAQAQAETTQRKEEQKVKEKAKAIRETGKIPKTWFCF